MDEQACFSSIIISLIFGIGLLGGLVVLWKWCHYYYQHNYVRKERERRSYHG